MVEIVRRKLPMNVGKCKVMRVTRRKTVNNLDIILNGIVMKEVDRVRYLGVNIDRDDVMKSELKHIVTEGNKFSYVLRLGNMERRSDGKKIMYECILV
jgi:hypothetical protein